MNSLGTTVEDFKVSCHMRNHLGLPKVVLRIPRLRRFSSCVCFPNSCSHSAPSGLFFCHMGRVKSQQETKIVSEGMGGPTIKGGVVPLSSGMKRNQIHRERLLLLFRAILRWTGFKNILIGVQLLYHVVFVSAVQHSESAMCIHVSPL